MKAMHRTILDGLPEQCKGRPTQTSVCFGHFLFYWPVSLTILFLMPLKLTMDSSKFRAGQVCYIISAWKGLITFSDSSCTILSDSSSNILFLYISHL